MDVTYMDVTNDTSSINIILLRELVTEERLLIRSFTLFQKPETWEQLKKKYDPTGQYTTKYLDEAHNHGINVWII